MEYRLARDPQRKQMRTPVAASFFELTSGRRGHFQLESGYHSELWFDLDSLFADAERIDPFVTHLADSLRGHDVAAVCGPLLGGAFLAQLVAGKLGVEFCFTERVMPRDTQGLFQASYRLPTAFRARVNGRRLAIVDDVMSAGSALRGTCSELQSHGAIPVVVGALMVLGDTGAAFFATNQLPVEAVVREDYSLWLPAECPPCAAGTPLENMASEG
jgi:orotate phosphoribosyltransferase